MIETSRHLREIISKATPLLKAISDEQATYKATPTTWSKKEIIGHLIDSAGNNQQKFVRLMEAPSLHFVKYDQDYWVKNQRYNLSNWHQLIDLWHLYNLHLSHVIAYVVPEKLQHEITISGVGPVTLEFVMKDYVEHLKHHLKSVIPTAGIDSKFKNIYNQ